MSEAEVHPSESIKCRHCGAPVSLELERAQVRCGACGGLTQVDAGRQAAARGAAGSARSLLAKEAVARRSAAMHARAARYNGIMLGLVIGFSLLLTWWFVAGVSGLASKMSPLLSIPLVLLSVATNLALGLVGARMIRAPDDQELGAVAMARCGSCGGFMPFEQGRGLSACPYCSAQALEPAALSPQLLQAGQRALDEGEREAARAEAENWRTAAEGRIGGLRIGAGTWVRVCVLGAFGMTAALIYGMLQEPSTSYPTGWIWVAVGGSCVAMIATFVRATRILMADNRAFEARFGVTVNGSEPGA